MLQSGHERSGRSSRLGSVSSLSSETGGASLGRTKSSSGTTSENGELDYKKLYEESQAENERLREKLRKSDETLKETQSLLDKAQSKSSLSETEKRERRAMERKLSEMEEELKVILILLVCFFFSFHIYTRCGIVYYTWGCAFLQPEIDEIYSFFYTYVYSCLLRKLML